MPISLLHDIKDTVYETPRDFFVEEVTHGVYEYLTWAPPCGEVLFQALLAQC